MRKALLALACIVVIAAAAWTGLWFYGKGRIVQEIETQAQIIRARGGTAEYDDIEVGGFPLGYTGRIIAPEFSMTRDLPTPEGADPASARYAWSAPWIEASATVMAPDTVEFTFPEMQDMILDLPEMEGKPLAIALTSEDLTVKTIRDGDDILFSGNATAMTGSFSHPSQQAGKIDATYSVRTIALSGKTAMESTGSSSPELAVDYTADGFSGSVDIAGTEAAPGGTIEFKGGATTGRADSLGQDTTTSSSITDLGATIRAEQLGSQPLDVGIGNIEIATRIPKDAAPQAQDFAYRIGIEDVTASDLIWAMFDPAAAFPREIEALVFDMDGTAIFNAPPSNAEAFSRAMESGLSVDVDTLNLNDLTIEALGAKAVATGTGSLKDNTPQGTATLSVDGFPGLMNALVKSGRIPPQQAMVVQLMVESFGKLDEDGDTIQFDFEARDGMMYVNSIPMGEAPSLP